MVVLLAYCTGCAVTTKVYISLKELKRLDDFMMANREDHGVRPGERMNAWPILRHTLDWNCEAFAYGEGIAHALTPRHVVLHSNFGVALDELFGRRPGEGLAAAQQTPSLDQHVQRIRIPTTGGTLYYVPAGGRPVGPLAVITRQ